MVIDLAAVCKKEKCTKKDKFRCCRFRQSCFPWFARDVVNGCPAGTIPNQFEGAFCSTVPCSLKDAEVCCVKPKGAIYTRSDMTRSNYAKVSPDDKAEAV